MMFNEGYRDKILVCRDCGNDFTFTAGEQEFYATKGLTNPPGRCPGCRAARRGSQQSSAPRAPRGEMHEAICATCGRTTSVPFVPREDRPVYCSDCFQSQRPSRPRREDSHSYSTSYSDGGQSYQDRGNGYNDRDGSYYGGGNSYSGGGRDRRDRRDGGRDRRDRW